MAMMKNNLGLFGVFENIGIDFRCNNSTVRAWAKHAEILVVFLAVFLRQPAAADVIHLSQNFESGAADLFEQQITDEVDTVVLTVSGGYLTEAIKIGRLIRSHKLMTIVPEGAACLSACAEAFLGGVSFQIDGTLAFHIPSRSGQDTGALAFDLGIAGGTITTIYRHEMGFGFGLTRDINRWTTSDRFLAFHDASQLMKYRNQTSVALPRFYQY